MYNNLFVLYLSTCLSGWALAELELVLLEEVSHGHHARTVENALPETMTFTLKRRDSQGYHTLNLVENKRLNENAPMFEVEVENGRQKLVKKEAMPLKNVKFYQDKANGGSFQAECLKRSSGSCRRILSGSLELDNEMYEIMPSPELLTERSFASSKTSPHIIVRIERSAHDKKAATYDPPKQSLHSNRGSRDTQGDIANKLRSLLRNNGLKTASENVDTSVKSVLKKHLQRTSEAEASEKGDGLIAQLKAAFKRRFMAADEDDTKIPPTVNKIKKKSKVDGDVTLDDTRMAPEVNGFESKRGELIRELEELLEIEETKARHTKRQLVPFVSTYALELLIVIDPSVWESYLAITSATDDMTQVQATEYRLRQYFSHIVNGISLRYEAIEDPDMDIYITLSGFLLYKVTNDSNPLDSSVQIVVDGDTEYVDGDAYLSGLNSWAAGLTGLPDNDHIMVFTAYDLYVNGDVAYNSVAGLAWVGAVCTNYRVSVQEISSYHLATSVAAHELGHNLGSYHDGDSDSSLSEPCTDTDQYLMAPSVASFGQFDSYIINPWRFSDCSVAAFKSYVANLTTAENNCLLDAGDHFDENEYNQHVAELPGERYSLDEQCKLFLGTSSGLCNGADATSERVCINMECTNPSDGQCYLYAAARGSPCGNLVDNKWCIDGECVSKTSSSGNSSGTTDAQPTTDAPTTQQPTTDAPTTQQPTTDAPTTQQPTTDAPTTQQPTTDAPTTQQPTTDAPTTQQPTTDAPTTQQPTTDAPTTQQSTTDAPTTRQSTTDVPSTPTISGDSCRNSGWEGLTCRQIGSILRTHYALEPASWCPTFSAECCRYCRAQVGTQVTGSCGNRGWYTDNGEFYGCKVIKTMFRDYHDPSLGPAEWCRYPEWKHRCCKMCAKKGV